MASLFKRYHSTEEYYDIERRIRAPWWGRPFSSAVNGILKTAGSPQIRVPAGKLAIDMHVHTLCSYCSFTRPRELLLRAAFLGLGGICIMDHHTVRGYEMALEEAERLKREGLLPEDFILLRGIEYSTLDGHIGGLFCSGDIPFKETSAQEAVNRITEMGGLPVAVHPFHKTGVRETLGALQGLAATEIYSGSVIRENEYLRAAALGTETARLGSSDSHFVNTCGMCYTLFPDSVKNEDDVRRAIEMRETEPCETAFYTTLRRLIRGMR